MAKANIDKLEVIKLKNFLTTKNTRFKFISKKQRMFDLEVKNADWINIEYIDLEEGRTKILLTKNKSNEEFSKLVKNFKDYERLKTKTIKEGGNNPLFLATHFMRGFIQSDFYYTPVIMREFEIISINARKIEIIVEARTVKNFSTMIELKNKFNHKEGFDQEVEDAHQLKLEIEDIISKDVDLFEEGPEAIDVLKKSEIVREDEKLKIFETNILMFFESNTGTFIYSDITRMMAHDVSRIELALNPEVDRTINLETRKKEYERRDIDFINLDIYQQYASETAREMDNLVIQGPPGTGKTQTIINILLNNVINKERTLLSSQKRAAMDVVIKKIVDIDPIFKYLFLNLNMEKSQFFMQFEGIEKLLSAAREESTFKSDNINKIVRLSKELRELNRRIVEDIHPRGYNKNIKFDLLERNSSSSDLMKIAKMNLLKDEFKKYKKEFKKISSVEIECLYEYYNRFELKEELEQEIEELKTENNLRQNIVSLRNAIIDNVVEVYTENRHAFDLFLKKAGNSTRVSVKNWYSDFEGFLLKLFPIFVASTENAARYVSMNVKFDHVVIDEASQVETTSAIPILYRGKRKTLIGDSQQMPPSKYFVSEIDTDDMEDDEFQYKGILEHYVNVLKVHNTMLINHYRSRSSDLMSFSNEHFYKNKLVILSDPNYKEKPIEHIQVKGIFKNGENDIEIDKVISTIKKLDKPENKDKEVGALFLSSKMLLKFEKASTLLKTKYINLIWAANLENIQGDEADIVVLAVGYTSEVSNLGPISYEGGEKRINVAISRAREKMIVIKSSPADSYRGYGKNKGPGILKKWLAFVEEQGKKKKVLYKQTLEFDSKLEEEIHEALSQEISDDCYITTQWPVGQYRIDQVLVCGDSPKLAIEIDGDHWHDNWTARERDYERQKFIEARGWTFFRIWESDWKYGKRKEISKFKKIIKKV